MVITRKVDDNWFEGRISGRKGIFPVSYVEVLIDPGDNDRFRNCSDAKPVINPAAHSILFNGTASGKESMGPHGYAPLPPLMNDPPIPGLQNARSTHTAPDTDTKNPIDQVLHIDTQSEPIP